MKPAFIAAVVVVGIADPLLHGQTQPDQKPLAFEVTSVKPTKTAGISLIGFYPGGRFSATNSSLRGLITTAWGLQSDQVDGGPAWITSDGFDVEAKGDATADQLRLMLRTLLIKRFKLLVRTETRELPVYELVIAKKDGTLGPALRPSSGTSCIHAAPTSGPITPLDPAHPSCGVLYSPIGRWTGRGVSTRSIANALVRMVGRVVVDRTGLAGAYDIDLQWTDLAVLFSPDASTPGGPSPPADGPSLFTALQEQLGLKLEATKGPVEVIVIDHLERPTPD